MHQHRRLGVPVGLGADVDAGDDDVDLAAGLGELDQPAEDAGDPVHVLDPALHRDLGAGRHREPLQRHPHPGREVEGGEDAGALGLGERAHVAAGVAEHDHPRHPLGDLGGEVADDADDDVGLVAPPRPLDRLERSEGAGTVAARWGLGEVVLDELARRQAVVGPLARRGEDADDLVGVDEAPPAQRDHPAGVLVERLERLLGRPPVAQRQAAVDGVGDLQHPLALLAGAGVGDAAAHRDLLQPHPFGHRREPLHQAADLVGLEADGGPDVEQDAVPQQALVGRAAELDGADGRHRLHEHPLQLGEVDDPAAVVGHRGEVAHLRYREQPLVVGVVVSDAVEEEDVLGRGEPLDGEVFEPPELEALGHHRVEAPVELLLVIALGRRSEGEVADAVGAHRGLAVGHRHHHPAQPRREVAAVEDAGQRDPGGVGVVGVAGIAAVAEVEIDRHLVPRGHRRDQMGDGADGAVEVFFLGVGGEDVEAGLAAVVEVLGGGVLLALEAAGGHPLELADSVVAPDHRLEHGLARRRTRLGEALRDERQDRLRTVHQGGHQLRAVGGGPAAPEVVEGGFGGVLSAAAGGVEQRLVVQAVPQLAGEVVDRRLASLGLGDQPVEERPEGVSSGRLPDLPHLVQPPLEDGEDRRDLIAQPAVRLGDAEQALLEVRRAVEAVHPVVGERPAEVAEEGGGEPLAAGVEVAQVGEEVFLAAPAVQLLGPGVGGLAPKQRADVDEEGEDLIFGGADRGVVERRAAADHPLLGDQPPEGGGADVEAEDQPLQVDQVPPAAVHRGLGGIGRRLPPPPQCRGRRSVGAPGPGRRRPRRWARSPSADRRCPPGRSCAPAPTAPARRRGRRSRSPSSSPRPPPAAGRPRPRPPLPPRSRPPPPAPAPAPRRRRRGRFGAAPRRPPPGCRAPGRRRRRGSSGGSR